jgi:hypothetical protein
MAVTIADGGVVVRFLPFDRHRGVVTARKQSFAEDVAYSPWIVGCGLSCPPAAIVGPGMTINIAGIAVTLTADADAGAAGGSLLAFSSQRRPRWR